MPTHSSNLPESPSSSHDSDADLGIDSEADAVLRAAAYSPPRRPSTVVVPGTAWGDADRYLIERFLGRGGMGSVYSARDTVLDRVVALKLLDAADADKDVAYRERLLREAKLAARVEHERIARVYDAGSHQGHAFVAMEYVQGGTLRKRMADGAVSWVEILDIAVQIAEGLAALHSQGVVHRDLKPENVMLTAQGGVKLLDFGLARHALAPLGDGEGHGRPPDLEGASVASAGTPGYMAPEQCAGQPIDARVDVFALGVILYELVTHEHLFRADTVREVIQATLAWAPERTGSIWRTIPDPLCSPIQRMLARDPAERFADGAQVLAALRGLEPPPHGAPPAAKSTRAISDAPTQPALSRPRFRPGYRRVVGHAVEIAAVAAAAVLLAAPHAERAPSPPPPSGMVRIDVGTIHVGQDAAEIPRECAAIGRDCQPEQMERETPRIEVTVAPFFLDQYEITNHEFTRMLNEFRGTLVVADDEDHHVPRYVRRNAGVGYEQVLIDLHARYGGIEYDKASGFRVRADQGRLPAVQVTWFGARLYCSSVAKRLPTEDEWEAAARGRDDRRFPWGAEPPRCGMVVVPDDGEAVARSPSCPKGAQARPVGSSPQDITPEGVHDLGGNVSEWTSSLYVPGNRTAHPPTDDTETPRVIRGGSWGESLMARSIGRNRWSPLLVGPNLGFRCALSAAQP